MTIQLNDFKRAWAEIGQTVASATERVGASGWYVLGREVERFETALAAWWPCAAAIGVGNGLDALEIALRCLSIGPGHKVLTTPLSAFATTLAIVRAGATPVFVDIDDRGLIDLEAAGRRLAVGDISAILPVHLYGHPVDLDHLQELAEHFAVPVLEDCAQSAGARWNSRPTGSVSGIAATSFYPTKNLGALGDGGAVLATDPTHFERARSLRSYGEKGRYRHVEAGLNSRLDELQAAILADAMLPNLDRWNRRRREIAGRLLSELPRSITTLHPQAAADPCWHLFPVRVSADQRDSFRRHLADSGVPTGVHYPHTIVDQPVLASAQFEAPPLPRAKAWVEQVVSLPIHPWLNDSEVETIVRTCQTWRS